MLRSTYRFVATADPVVLFTNLDSASLRVNQWSAHFCRRQHGFITRHISVTVSWITLMLMSTYRFVAPVDLVVLFTSLDSVSLSPNQIFWLILPFGKLNQMSYLYNYSMDHFDVDVYLYVYGVGGSSGAIH